MNNTSVSDTYALKSAVAVRAVGSDLVLLDLEAGTHFVINQVGASIWALLRDAVEHSALVDSIINEYEVGRETAEEDVRAFTNSLVEAGLATRE